MPGGFEFPRTTPVLPAEFDWQVLCPALFMQTTPTMPAPGLSRA